MDRNHLLTVAMLVCACKTPRSDPPGGAVTSDATAAEVASAMDRAMDPCRDFYRFACGGWIDATPLPPDQPRYGRFQALRERNNLALKGILERAATREDDQIGRFWRSCMDEAAIESRGLTTLAPVLASIEGVSDASSLFAMVGALHRQKLRVLFDLDVEPDYKAPGVNLAFLGQGGLGLPDREFYRGTEGRLVALREGYLAHVGRVFELSGMAPTVAAGAAADVVAFEVRLAEISLRREDLREPEARYHKLDRAGLDHHAALPWDVYFSALGRPDVKAVSLAPASYFADLVAVVSTTPPATMRHYLRWHVLHAAAPHLPEAFVRADFEFYGKQLSGQAELAPRWKRCVNDSDRALGESIGREFVEEHFGKNSREVALGMIRQVESAFSVGLAQLAWMDAATRTAADGKMRAIVNKIGYPEQWRDYGGLRVGDDHLANVVAAAEFETTERIRGIDGPVDVKRWEMTPPTVNAYYNPSGNEMVFPAGILQPPFFHEDWPMAMNFGGIGMVMGHELTHGFDDQGRKFDGAGTLREWWAPEVGKRFEARAACVEDLYSSYEVQPGVHLSGKLTLGENIADLGGIKESHRAYLQWAADHGVDPHSSAMEGLTHEQLFFVAFSQIWCSKSTPENEQVMAMTDSHSHARYRVNGPLANLPEFGAAFSCEAGAPMRPTATCEVW
jgi:putative endopeptidase